VKQSIIVIGSSNTDMVIKADHLPAAGETILGGTFFMNDGGKGANQAVAAARLGGNVTFIAKTGNDTLGQQAKEMFQKENIDTSYILTDPILPSGVALIVVDKKGENSIVVASGANSSLLPDDLDEVLPLMGDAAVVLVQLEIPLVTVEYIAAATKLAGTKMILNPAPARALPDSLLNGLFLITPNENEAGMLTGLEVNDVDSAKQAARKILERGVKNVIITLGANGALVFDDGIFTHVPVLSVKAVDSTAAGDVFNGALAVAISEGQDLVSATEFACRAAAISVTRLGALQSAPTRDEVRSFVNVANSVL
jgi:ribokinase